MILPIEDLLGCHFEEGDEGVDYPVGQPLAVVQLGRALHSADRRVPDQNQHLTHTPTDLTNVLSTEHIIA